MGMVQFLMLLSGFGVLSSLITEAIKKFVDDKENFASNLICILVSVVVGCGGTFIYYIYNGVPCTVTNVISGVLMGFASGLVSMCGYDKVKQCIEQLGGK